MIFTNVGDCDSARLEPLMEYRIVRTLQRTPEWQELAATLTYEDIRLLLCDLSHQYIRCYGGEFEEIFSQCHLHFMNAYQTYEPDKGGFSARVTYVVWNRLIDTLRRKYTANKHIPTHLFTDEEVFSGKSVLDDDDHQDCDTPVRRTKANTHRYKPKSPFSLSLFTTDLSDDAKKVVELVFDSPTEVVLMTHASSDKNTPTLERVKRSLGRYLISLGWDWKRIASSFKEIQTALNE